MRYALHYFFLESDISYQSLGKREKVGDRNHCWIVINDII